MGEQYYVRIRGRVSGPFDYKQLKVLAQQHRLNRTHEISDDTITWYPASDRTELFTRLTTQGVALKEDIATVVKEIPIKAETASEPRQATPLADSWYVSVNGEKAGPFSTARLRSDASVGILSPDVLVWTGGMSDWATGSSIPGLFSPVHVPQPVVKPRPLCWSWSRCSDCSMIALGACHGYSVCSWHCFFPCWCSNFTTVTRWD